MIEDKNGTDQENGNQGQADIDSTESAACLDQSHHLYTQSTDAEGEDKFQTKSRAVNFRWTETGHQGVFQWLHAEEKK